MTHGSLFSGIGGFDLAAEWMGWQNIFHCERNEFGQKVLKHYWPNAETLTDITKSDFTKYANKIDILTGGFPCQPYSLAGKRKGKEDDRHLWPEMLRAIKEIQPSWVVGENVFGLVNWSGGMVFHEVQSELEAAGYEVFPYVLPAVSVNAPHRRDRVWFVAYSHSNRNRNIREQDRKTDSLQGISREAIYSGQSTGTDTRDVANPDSNGFNGSYSQNEIDPSKGREYAQRDIKQMGEYAADTSKQRFQGGESEGNSENRERQGGKEKQRIGCNFRNVRNGWQNFPTESPLCNGNDGLPYGLDGITFSKWRNESIKAGGNAIVPQVALQIFKTIEQYESNK